MDERDRLILETLAKHARNGGTGAREISREVRGAGSPGTVQKHLRRLKDDGLAAQTRGQKWIPSPKHPEKQSSVEEKRHAIRSFLMLLPTPLALSHAITEEVAKHGGDSLGECSVLTGRTSLDIVCLCGYLTSKYTELTGSNMDSLQWFRKDTEGTSDFLADLEEGLKSDAQLGPLKALVFYVREMRKLLGTHSAGEYRILLSAFRDDKAGYSYVMRRWNLIDNELSTLGHELKSQIGILLNKPELLPRREELESLLHEFGPKRFTGRATRRL